MKSLREESHSAEKNHTVFEQHKVEYMVTEFSFLESER